MENKKEQHHPEGKNQTDERPEEQYRVKSNRGPVREQVSNVGESGRNTLTFFFKEFYALIIYFVNYFKSRQKK
jgi:hypothetical protein